jgi:ATP-dependent DNA helicase DinG
MMETTAKQFVPDFFPVNLPVREKQAKALSFIQRAIDRGYRDIVIEAPTGVGKSLVGAAVCFWGAHSPLAKSLEGQPGGYYLVTQKLLQDQLEEDFTHFLPDLSGKACLLKSATEYECPQFVNCMVGRSMKKGSDRFCELVKEKVCHYMLARQWFIQGYMSVTNYPYFFTERTFVRQFPKKKILIADECHTLEGQILGFVEMSVTADNLREWAASVAMPKLDDKLDFCEWLEADYLPIVEQVMNVKEEIMRDNPQDNRAQVEFQKLQTHIGRIKSAIDTICENPVNWVYWQEMDEFGQPKESVAKPLLAHPYADKLIRDAASLRIYMSAYPGPKDTFCAVAGLAVDKVAWVSLASTFPKENRPVFMNFSGSMGQKCIKDTMPLMLKDVVRVLDKHPESKGLIHGHSYKICNEINAAILMSEHGTRLLFAANAAERTKVFEKHVSSEEPTVLLSPSMTEGFNLKDDLARFQIIAKVPYPYLGNPQVAAKKDADQDWYTLQTVQTIIQACGRIVRSETDHGATYILDEDFERLYVRNQKFFPRWFTESFVWSNGSPV